MRVFGHSSVLVSVCAALALAACGDDGGSKPTGAPDTVLDTQPSAQTNQRHFSFTFHGTPADGSSANAVLTFNCALDGAAPSLCTSPLDVDVTDGDHTFSVFAVQEGNSDPSPASASWHVDSTAPDTMITSGPPSFDNSTTATIVFTGTPTDDIAKFECAFDSDTYAECTSPYMIDNLISGTHTVKVRAVDAIGNADPTPAQHSWTTDTSTPDTMITGGPASSSVTNGSATFTFTSTLTSSVAFECAFDGGSFTACVSPISYNSLPGGVHTFAVRAKNTTTNVVDPTPASRMWMVDATAPTVSIDMKPSDPTMNTMPMFTFSTTDTDVAMFECQIDGVAVFAACTSPFTGPTVTEGLQTFRVRATDNVGNVSTTTYSWTVDTTPPTITITSGPSGATSDKNPIFTFSIDGSPTSVQCQMDTGAFADCVSPKSYTALADGAHTFTIKAVDAAGNTASVNRMFTLTTVGPTVTITSGPTGSVNNNAPTFTFTTSGAVSTDCRFDGGTFATCTSPFTSQALAEGQHTFEVRAHDAANNTNSATRTFTVDTIAPTVTITSGPAGPTNQPKPTFTFITNGNPTATECRFDTAAYAACVSPFTPAANLSQGAHEFDVRVTDAAGNTGTDTRSFSVSTNGPVVTITAGPNGATNINTPTWTFTTSGSPTSIQCKIDATAFANCTSPYQSAQLADGTHTFVVQVSDAAGNSNSDSRTIMLDTSAPTVTITGGPSGPTNMVKPTFTFSTAGSPSAITCNIDSDLPAACTSPFTAPNTLADGPHMVTVTVSDSAGNVGVATRSFTVDTSAPTVMITNAIPDKTNNKPTFTFTTTGNPTVIECAMDLGAYSACVSPFTSSPLGGGNHTFHVRVADDAGNTGSASQDFMIDSTAPTVTITSGPTGSCPTATTCTPTNIQTPVFHFNVSAGWTTLQCHMDVDALVDCHGSFTVGAAGTGGTFMAGTLGQGGHNFEVVACNASGNCSSDIKSFTVDITPPVLNITAGPSGNCGGNGAASANCQDPKGVSPNTPSFVFAANADANTYECGIQQGSGAITYSTCASHTGQSLSALTPDGNYTFYVRVTDLAYNQTVKSVTFNVDTAAPSIAFGTLPTAEPNGVKTLPTIGFTVTDPHLDLTSDRCSIDTGAYVACNADNVSYTFSGSAEGEHSLQVQSRDTAGNLGTSTLTKFIYDKTAPTIAITNLTPHGSDAAVSMSATATLNVKVTDATGTAGALTTPIAVTCGYTKAGGGTANCMTYTTAQYLAGIDVAPSGSLGEGVWTLSITATDGATNTTTTTSTFTVDLTNPDVNTLALTPASPNKNATPVLSFKASDNVALASVACSFSGPASGSAACTLGTAPNYTYQPTLSAEGDYTLTVLATDTSGRTNTQTIHYYYDHSPPTISAITGPGPGTANPTNSVVKMGFTIANTNGGPTPITTTCYFDTTANPGTCTTGGPFPQTLTNVSPVTNLADGTHEGMHTFFISTVDAAGNTATASQTFYVDTIKPTVTISAPTANQIVNTLTPTITFVPADTSPGAIDTSSYVCKIDGTPVTCTSTTFQPTVTEGPHTLTVTVKDTAGNQSTQASVSFVADTTGPMISTVTGAPASSPAAVTMVTLTFHTNDANGVASAQCDPGTGVFGACTTFTASTTSADTTGTLILNYAADGSNDGLKTIRFRTTDQATPTGNVSAIYTVTYTVDNTKPTISAATVGPTSGGFVNSNSVTVTPTGSDNITPAGSLVFTCALEPSTTFGSCSSMSIADGTGYKVDVKATDQAGNVSNTFTTAAFTVDATAPSGLAITAPAAGATIGPTGTFTFGGATDTHGPVVYKCGYDGAAVGTLTTCTSPATVDGTLSETTHTFDVVAVDAAGNTSSRVTLSFTFDKTPPPAPTIAFTPSTTYITSHTGVTAAYTSTGATSYQCAPLDTAGGPFTACTSGGAVTDTSADGTHHWYVKAVDAAGNVSSATDGQFKVDTTAPTITIAEQGNTSNTCSTGTLVLTNPAKLVITGADVSGGSGIDNASMTCTGETCSFMGGVATTGTVNMNESFTVNGKDLAGNAATAAPCMVMVNTFVAIKAGPRGPTNDPKVAYAFELSDKAIAQSAVAECSYDGGAFGKCTTDKTYVVDKPVAAKVHTFTVRAKAGDKVLGTDKASFELDPIAMCLDGNKQVGTADLSTLLGKQDKSSIELWFKGRDAAATSFPLFAIGAHVTAHVDAGNLVVALGEGRRATHVTFALPAQLDLSQWHHYAVSLTSSSLAVFVDGAKLDGTVPAKLSTLGALVGTGDVQAELAGPGAYLDLRITTATRGATFHPTFPAMVDKSTTALYPLGEAKGRLSSDLVDDAPDLEWTAPESAWSTCAK